MCLTNSWSDVPVHSVWYCVYSQLVHFTASCLRYWLCTVFSPVSPVEKLWKKSLCQCYLMWTCYTTVSAIHPIWHLASADWAQLSPAWLHSFRGGQRLGAELWGRQGACSAYWVAWLGRRAQRGFSGTGPVGRQAWQHSALQLPVITDQVTDDNSQPQTFL